MNDEIKERLSELVDDEADRFSTRRLVNRLIENEGEREIWARYQLVSDIVASRLMAMPATGRLSERVRGSLEREPAHSASGGGPRRLARPLAGVAVAASVAAVAILGARMFQAGADDPSSSLAAQAPAQQSAVASNRWSVTQPAVEARLNRYLVNHSEYAGYGVSGMVGYARIVGYDATD